MAKGICVFAEEFEGKLEPVFAELVSVARSIQATTKEPIKALVCGDCVEGLIEEIKEIGVDEIDVIQTKENMLMQDDAVSTVIARALQEIDPSAVIIPATVVGRSIFARVAAKIGCGLTADCTELLVGTREDGSFYIKQNKPSFGANVMVTIITRPNAGMQMMTVRPGVYPVAETIAAPNQVKMFSGEVEESALKVIKVEEAENNADSIMSAETVVACGKAVLEEDNYALMEDFAKKIGAAVGGTRPIADAGKIPFDHQIGQTGFTIRPKVCISLGASGAIQHTEGIKDTKLMIAINTDENAPIFNIADYGLIGDLKEVLEEYMKLS